MVPRFGGARAGTAEQGRQARPRPGDATLHQVTAALLRMHCPGSAQIFSALKNTGTEDAWRLIGDWLALGGSPDAHAPDSPGNAGPDAAAGGGEDGPADAPGGP